MLHEKLLQDPEHVQVLMQIMTDAIAADIEGDAPQALALLERAVALEPAFVPAQMRRASVLEGLQRYDEAIAVYDDCLRRFASLDDAVTARRQALSFAVEQCESLLQAEAGDSFLWCRQAQYLLRLERFEEALNSTEQALILAPDQVLALNLRGNAYLALGSHEQAVQCYDRILAQVTDDASACFNRGNVLQQMGCLHQARWSFEQALLNRPDFPEAEVALSHVLLMLGEDAAGWRHHEARWRTGQLQGAHLFEHIPAWLGTDSLAGRSILLWAEQGLGDTLQFVRYVPQVAAMARQVTVCVPLALQSLLASLVTDKVAVISDYTQLDRQDFQCPLMSLPLALHEPVAIPANVPYLHADAALSQQWAARLRPQQAAPGKLKVGLVWAGRQFGQRNHTRDIPLRDLRALTTLPLDLISLQPQVAAEDVSELSHWPQLQRFDAGLTDMAQTAALISQLDLVISADTAVIHLAGALGKPAWLLLRFASEWRWGWRTSSSRWYPGVTLFRQARPGDWPGVVEQVVARLRQRMDG